MNKMGMKDDFGEIKKEFKEIKEEFSEIVSWVCCLLGASPLPA